MPASAACASPRSAVYRRRQPERTLLYRTVQTHLATWLALQDDGSGGVAPAVTEREFRRYLECCILAHGFARARCADCGHDFLVAYSCKCRGVCPSCTTRRMVETAAHLADHVIPRLAGAPVGALGAQAPALLPRTRSGSSQRRTAYIPDRHRAGAAATQSRRQCSAPLRRRGLHPPLWCAAGHPSAFPLRRGGWCFRGRCGTRRHLSPGRRPGWVGNRRGSGRRAPATAARGPAARPCGAACCRQTARR